MTSLEIGEACAVSSVLRKLLVEEPPSAGADYRALAAEHQRHDGLGGQPEIEGIVRLDEGALEEEGAPATAGRKADAL